MKKRNSKLEKECKRKDKEIANYKGLFEMVKNYYWKDGRKYARCRECGENWNVGKQQDIRFFVCPDCRRLERMEWKREEKMKEEVLKQPQRIQAICSETGGRFKQGLKKGTTLELRCCLKLFKDFPDGNEDRVSAITAELCSREKERSPGMAIPKGTKKNIHIHYNTSLGENKEAEEESFHPIEDEGVPL